MQLVLDVDLPYPCPRTDAGGFLRFAIGDALTPILKFKRQVIVVTLYTTTACSYYLASCPPRVLSPQM